MQPSSLARDAQVLCHEHNYEIAHAGIMDMFPYQHVESIALFTKNDFQQFYPQEVLLRKNKASLWTSCL